MDQLYELFAIRLKQKYREAHVHLKNTGSGVLPGGPDANILGMSPIITQLSLIVVTAEIHCTFPLFDDLNAIWCGIPLFDSKLSSSDANVNHSQKLLSFIQQKTPCDGEDGGLHGQDTDQAEHNAEGPGVEKGDEGLGHNEEGVDNDIEMDFGNDNQLCFSPVRFGDGDNPQADCDEVFDGDGDMQMLSPRWGLLVCHSHPWELPYLLHRLGCAAS